MNFIYLNILKDKMTNNIINKMECCICSCNTSALVTTLCCKQTVFCETCQKSWQRTNKTCMLCRQIPPKPSAPPRIFSGELISQYKTWLTAADGGKLSRLRSDYVTGALICYWAANCSINVADYKCADVEDYANSHKNHKSFRNKWLKFLATLQKSHSLALFAFFVITFKSFRNQKKRKEEFVIKFWVCHLGIEGKVDIDLQWGCHFARLTQCDHKYHYDY